MSAKLIFMAGVLGVGGYVGHTMMNHDAAVFPLSKQRVQSVLLAGRTTLPRRDGDGTIEIRGVALSSNGVTISMRYGATAPILSCQAIITEVSVDSTRVTTDCGGASTGGSAIANTGAALQVPMLDEHVRSQLNGVPFNRNVTTAKEIGIVLNNVDAMNREAMLEADRLDATYAALQASERKGATAP